MTSAPLVCALSAALSAAPAPQPALQSGDVVLQTSRSRQSKPIQDATQSPYSHVGLIEVTKEGVFVIEAVQPVKRTPLRVWRQRGERGRWLVLRHPDLTSAERDAVVDEAKRYLGRPYDLLFGWDDERLYCSELVAKAYARGAGKIVGRMQKVRELRVDLVRDEAFRRRFGKDAPLDLELLTPASLAEDPRFVVVANDFATGSASAHPAGRR